MRAALVVFAEKGTDSSTMAEIAKRAGIGKGTIYEYFPGKSDLTMASFILMMDELDQHLAAALYQKTDPEQIVRIFLNETFEFFVRHQDKVNVLSDMWSAGVPRKDGQPLVTGLLERFEEFKAWLVSILDDGVNRGLFRPMDSHRVASVLMATIDGLLFQAMIGALKKDRSKYPEVIFETFLEGIKAKGR